MAGPCTINKQRYVVSGNQRSHNGTIFVSGFEQATDMANVEGGELTIVTVTHNGSAAHIIFSSISTRM